MRIQWNRGAGAELVIQIEGEALADPITFRSTDHETPGRWPALVSWLRNRTACSWHKPGSDALDVLDRFVLAHAIERMMTPPSFDSDVWHNVEALCQLGRQGSGPISTPTPTPIAKLEPPRPLLVELTEVGDRPDRDGYSYWVNPAHVVSLSVAQPLSPDDPPCTWVAVGHGRDSVGALGMTRVLGTAAEVAAKLNATRDR